MLQYLCELLCPLLFGFQGRNLSCELRYRGIFIFVYPF
jgi:hypothetical protein